MKNILFSMAAACGLVFAVAAQAQGFPDKTVRLTVGYQPGGAADLVSRLVAKGLGEKHGYQVLVENRPGAGGFIASEFVAKAPPDGYTLLLANSSFAYIPAMFSKLKFDTLKDFSPIALIASTQTVLVVHPAVPAKSVKQLIALAKAYPGKLNYASGGTGGSTHLSMELFKSMAGTNIVHIPYKGNGPSISDLVSGRVDVSIPPIGAVLSFVKSGKLRALATSGGKRSFALPDVPTISESGVVGYEAGSWYGYMAPAKTPRAVISKLSADMTDLLKVPSFADHLQNVIGAEPEGLSSEEFSKFLARETEKWGKVIRDAGIKGE
ncbi:MAG: tripartite tricarboxylate transporter substrate binding protein [Burkholderiales bacterium]|nr:tripartite tricarboxylate transporter substrate binding protein [Burkholderiales bacterium]